MKIFIILCSSIAFYYNVFGQTISGTLTDKNTNETLISATVQIKGTLTGTTTDYDGNYTIDVEDKSGILVFSYVGFEKLEMPYAFENGNLNLVVNAQLEESGGTLLEETVITASRFARKISEETVSIDIIKPTVLGTQNLSGAHDALSKSPGVTVVENQINIRGGSGYSYGAGSRVLVLQDGIPMISYDNGQPLFETLPLENIGQIEVIKGAASALYGSAAMNGIVNIQTAYAKSKPETVISINSTYYDTPRDQFDEEGNLIDKKWWVKDSITYFVNDDTVVHHSDDPHPYRANINVAHRRKMGNQQKVDFSIEGTYVKEQKWVQAANNNKINVNGSIRVRAKENLTIGLNYAGFRGATADALIWNGLEENKYIPNQLVFDPNRKVTLRFGLSPYIKFNDNKGNFHKIQSRHLYVNNMNTNNQGNSANSIYTEYQFQKELSKSGVSISAGVVGIYVRSKAELFEGDGLSGANIAIYAQADKRFFDKLSVTLGARVETNILSQTKAETKPVFRMGANYQVAEATFLRASFGQGYRFPTIAEKFITTTFGSQLGIAANPELKSETGWSYEIGAKQGWQTSNKNFKGFFDVAFFYMRYKDMIEFNVDNNAQSNTLVTFTSKNVGNTQIFGVETNLFAIGKIKNSPTNLVIGYTYINPKFIEFDKTTKNGGVADYNVLKYRFRHTLTASWDVNVKGFTFGTNWQYYSFTENIDKAFNDESGTLGINLAVLREDRKRDGREANKEPRTYRGDFILDLRVGYQIKSDIVKLSFHVKNVANREYSLRPALIEAPRNFSARVDFRF